MSIKKESIEHWKAMIEWVREQDENKRPNPLRMERKIKMNWMAEYCPYCIKYYARYYYCPDCPISKSGNCCNDKNSIWRMIYESQTWGEWLIHANDMLLLLESLSEEEE